MPDRRSPSPGEVEGEPYLWSLENVGTQWAPPEGAPPPRRRRLRVTKEAALGLVLLGAFALAGVVGPLVAPHDPLAQDLARRLQPPGAPDSLGGVFVLGSDSLGRDVLSRLLLGARTSLLVGLGSVLLSGAVGTLLGLTSGYFGGWWDTVLMRVVDVWLAMPYLVLAIAVSVVLGPSLQNLVLVLALTTWVPFARIVRGEVQGVQASEAVLAARVLGASSWRILWGHVLPQAASTVMVLASLMVGSTVLFEASLSFLGLGVQRPNPSLGNMLLDGVDVVGTAWWVSFFPGLAILLAVAGINLLGDWLRDATDPRRPA